MIDVQEATQKAIEHLKSIYQDLALGKILVEEAERTDDNEFWIVSLIFKKINPTGIVGESIFADNRSLKTFRLEAETGEVKSMKNR